MGVPSANTLDLMANDDYMRNLYMEFANMLGNEQEKRG